MHTNDPAEIKRRDEQATREMFAMVGRPLGVPHLDVARSWEPVDPYAGMDDESRERERKAREVRRRLGWE